MLLFHDFYPLWAAARIMLRGGNPYDAQLIAAELANQGIISQFADPGGFHNPPWTLWIFAPFGLLDPHLALATWIALMALILWFCWRLAKQEIRALGGFASLTSPPRIALAFIAFLPLFKLILFGQTSHIALLGFLLFNYHYFKSQDAKAGLSLSLTLLKPNLFLPLYAFLLARSLITKRHSVLLGLILGLLMQSGVSYLVDSAAFAAYSTHLLELSAARQGMMQASLSQILVHLTGLSWLSLIISILAMAWGAINAASRKTETLHFLYVLSFIGLFFSPYAWSHDYILLLVPFLILVDRLATSAPLLTLGGLALISSLAWVYISGNIITREWISLLILLPWFAAWIGVSIPPGREYCRAHL